MSKTKHSGLTVAMRIILDPESAKGDSIALGACIESLTSEGWHLEDLQEEDDGELTAHLNRTWDVGLVLWREPTVGMALGENAEKPVTDA